MTRLILALAVVCAVPSASAQEIEPRPAPGPEAGGGGGAAWERAAERARRGGAGVYLRVLKDYDLPSGVTATEPIVVIGGSATIDGHAEDDVVVIGGTLRVGPTAAIDGDVAAIGGEAIIDPAAQIRGEVDRTTVIGPDLDIDIGAMTDTWWPAFALGATLLRLTIVLIVSMLLTAIVPGRVTAIAQRVSTAPLASAGIGVAAQILFIPAVIAVVMALIISIVGILLLLAFPFVLGAAALMWIAGYAAVAITIGARLRGERGVSDSPMRDLLVGFVLLSAVTLLAQVIALGSMPLGLAGWMMRPAGALIEYVAWTVGLGAALAVLIGGRQAATKSTPPPPLPLTSAAPTTP